MMEIVATTSLPAVDRPKAGTPCARVKKKEKKKRKRILFLVATTSLPAVYRPNDDRWNAARSCQNSRFNSIWLLLILLFFWNTVYIVYKYAQFCLLDTSPGGWGVRI